MESIEASEMMSDFTPSKKRPLEEDTSAEETSEQQDLDRFRPAKLYDRQIRLWGWEAQQRLMTSRLLIYGLNGVGVEILKNLMLSGIRNITVIDPKTVVQADFSTNFFIRQEDLGQFRVSASAVRARLLNPTCVLETQTCDVSELTEDIIKSFDLVVLNNVPLAQAIRIGNICRSLKIPIFVSQILGFHAFFVNDLDDINFEIPPFAEKPVEKPAPSEAVLDRDTPSTSKGETDVDVEVTSISNGNKAKPKESDDKIEWEKRNGKEDEVQTLSLKCPSIEAILSPVAVRRSGLASPMPKRSHGIRRIDPYLNLEALLEFVNQFGRYPDASTAKEDLTRFEAVIGKLRNEGDLRDIDPMEFLVQEPNFACAIFGGTLTQEVICALTRRGYPIYNFYYLAANDAVGSREYIE